MAALSAGFTSRRRAAATSCGCRLAAAASESVAARRRRRGPPRHALPKPLSPWHGVSSCCRQSQMKRTLRTETTYPRDMHGIANGPPADIRLAHISRRTMNERIRPSTAPNFAELSRSPNIYSTRGLLMPPLTPPVHYCNRYFIKASSAEFIGPNPLSRSNIPSVGHWIAEKCIYPMTAQKAALRMCMAPPDMTK